MKRLLWLFCGAALAQAPGVASNGDRQITFILDRAAPSPSHYEVQLDTVTGQGAYRQQGTPLAPGSTLRDPTAEAAETPIAVDPSMLKKLLAATPAITRHHCESHSTNIAQTGRKTLRLSEGTNAAECTFNFSDDDRVNTAAALFESIAETVQFGQRLSADLRFDRLGLDAEMNNLQDAVKDGRAVALGNIAPVLQRIAGDERVLERVRKAATSLLSSSGMAAPQAAPASFSSDE